MGPAARAAFRHIAEPGDRAMIRHDLATPRARATALRATTPRVSSSLPAVAGTAISASPNQRHRPIAQQRRQSASSLIMSADDSAIPRNGEKPKTP